MVPKGGVEPPCLAAHEPESCVSANFTTWALFFKEVRLDLENIRFNGQAKFREFLKSSKGLREMNCQN